MHLPLSEKLRPSSLQDIAGQKHLLKENGLIARMIALQKPVSILLYGPPGCGKTTIARLYAKAFAARFFTLSATFSGINDVKKIVQESKESPLLSRQTILFIDEIHRFNKAQQDAFLSLLEDGSIILIGATTENPSFSLNNALLSRLRILHLFPLSEKDLKSILDRYEQQIQKLPLSEKAREYLIQQAQGDGRHLLNMIENIEDEKTHPLEIQDVAKLLQKKAPLYDKHHDQHHALISALHKSIRGSDPDAAIYWLCRMLAGGEDPLYIARRMIRMAMEDIGLADPQALHIAHLAWHTYNMLGSCEGEIALAEAAVYLALAPKSNAIYTAFEKGKEIANATDALPPPDAIINAPTKLMKEMGYGKDYIYDHDTPLAFSGQNYFPKKMKRPSFYHPVERGLEREMKKRLMYFQKLRQTLAEN